MTRLVSVSVKMVDEDAEANAFCEITIPGKMVITDHQRGADEIFDAAMQKIVSTFYPSQGVAQGEVR